MILHGLTIDDWRNIGHLELRDLNRPLVLLHGPNRVGKSSIVAALRSCLLDDDHDSTKAALKESISWRTGKTPQVQVEFETGGAVYRLMKRFAKGSSGGASLERREPNGSWQSLHRGKEAGREARRVLGLENSNDGLNQLLWLNQGEMRLPEENKLNLPLQKQFEAVLGTLLTARDHDFFEALQSECGRYFTEKMAEKKGSPLAELEKKLRAADDLVTQLKARRDRDEQQRLECENGLAEIAELARRAEGLRAAVREAEQRVEATRERRRLHETALAAQQAAERELQLTVRRSAEYSQARQRLIETGKSQLSVETDFTAAQARHTALISQQAERQTELDSARAAYELQETRRGEWEDLRRLCEIDRERQALTAELEHTQTLQARIAQLKQELAACVAPEKSELEALRKNRTRAAILQAELAAASLRLTWRAQSDGTLEVVLDETPARELGFRPGEQLPWSFQQQAVVRIANVGEFEIRRGSDDRALGDKARELAALDGNYRQGVERFGHSASAEDALEKLDELRLRRVEIANDTTRLESELKLSKRVDRSPPEATLERRERERTEILTRRPELTSRVTDDTELQAGLAQFTLELSRLKSAYAGAEQAAEAHRKQFQSAEVRLQQTQNALATQTALRAAAEAELARLGDEYLIQSEEQSRRKLRDEAAARVAATALTPEEQGSDKLLADAKSQLANCEERCRSQERQSDLMLGELRSTQGLHEELAAAEAEREVLERQRNELRLEADAHKLLRTLFEECRDSQVTCTTEAVGTSVLRWASRLGLPEFEQVDFDGGYLPVALKRSDAAVTVELERESGGTCEQLALLVRLAAGKLLANEESQLALLDDPLTHTDRVKHRRMLEILEELTSAPAEGARPPLQIVILSCHPERFDQLRGLHQIDLEQVISRS